MKLSNETLSVLKNFSTISEGLFVPGGSKIRVKDALGKVLAQAVVVENFPSFCIKEASKFVGILTADKTVELDFRGPDIVIQMLGGKSKINYRGSPKNLVNAPKDNDLEVTDAFCQFTIKKDQLDYVLKMTSLLGLPNIAIENVEADLPSGSKTFIRVFDPKNDGENTQTLDIEAESTAKNYQVILTTDTLKFVDGDYRVLVSQNVVQFKHATLNLNYWLAPELGSTFSEE